MEYIERASFVEIYGLKLAYPISLLSLCFEFCSKHTTSLHSIDANGFGVCFENG